MVAPVTAEPRLAPADPSLPPEWKALVDGSTGYLYYWNTVTNVTTYEKPSSGYQEQDQKSVYPLSAASGYPSSAVTTNGHMNGSSGSSVYGNQSPGQPPMGASMGGSYKRSAEAYESDDRFMYKRPKTAPASSCSSYDAAEYRRQHEITVLGNDVPAPFLSFDSAGLPLEILRELQGAGFASPTPIQAQSWPIAILGRDIVAIAKTGSGKTLGYLLPAFLHLQNRRNNPRVGPTVLVLAPTRELATQIHDEATKFGRCLRLTSACVYGGTPRGMQLRDLERGPDIVIATPGRLNDFLEAGKVTLRQVSYLVLDEADRMLDMGFEPQIRKIVMQAPSKRQTLMYTATWPKEVRRIAADLLVSPAQVNIGNTDDLTANKAITQFVEMVHPYEKSRRLQQILRSQEPGSKIIIFCSTKRMCDDLARSLRGDFGAVAIHGDKSQSERDWVLAQFKSGKSPVLVATDVAARGLDIKDIRAVINYDFPSGVEDYVHRIGRTGRAGATGLAYTFLSEQDGKYAKELIKVLEGANQKVPPELRDMAARGGYVKARGRWDSGGARSSSGYGGGGSSFRGGSSSSWNSGPPAGGWGVPPPAAGSVAPARYEDGWGNNGRQQPQQSSYGRSSPTGSRSRSYDRHNEDKSRGRSGSPRHRYTGTAVTAGTGAAAAAAAPSTAAGENGYASGNWNW